MKKKFQRPQIAMLILLVMVFSGASCVYINTDSGRDMASVSGAEEAFMRANPQHWRYELTPTTIHQLERELELEYSLPIFSDHLMLERFSDNEEVTAYLENRIKNRELARELDEEEFEEIKAAIETGDELFLFDYHRADGKGESGLLLISETGEVKISSHLFE